MTFKIISESDFRDTPDSSFFVTWRFNNPNPNCEPHGELKYYPHKEIIYSADQVMREVKEVFNLKAGKINIIGRDTKTLWLIRDGFNIREYFKKVGE